MEIPTSERPQPLDIEWHSRFRKYGALEAFDYLSGDKVHRKEQKAKFLAGEIENPALDYPQLDMDSLEKNEQGLLGLKKDLLAKESNKVIRQAYCWRVNEKIAEIRMLKAAQTGEMRRFRKYSFFVYGKPSLDIFAYTVQVLRAKAKEASESDRDEVLHAAQALNEVLPQNLPEAEIFTLPAEEKILLAQRVTLEEFGGLINLVPEQKGLLEPAAIKDIFQQGLKLLGAETEGWQAVLDASKTAISVVQERQEVAVPDSRKRSPDRLRRLTPHELGTHVKRRIRGERSKLMLLGLGLDRFEKGEEGVAMMREQAIAGKLEDFSGLEGHLAIGLAVGLDGQPRDFRRVYEVLESYFLFKQVMKDNDLETAKKEAQKRAWNRCVRTFRGTDSSTPGTCFTKDIAYREGNIGVWEVIGKTPDEMRRFSIGKYDPANERHLWILDTLGITDQDLENLKK